jgi:hypothetical protein
MMSFIPFFLFLSFILCYCYAGTIEFIRYRFLYRKVFTPIFFYCLSHFISIGDPALVQSEMILSFLYPQFNIDVYIPIYNIYAPLSFLSFFLCNLKYSNGRFFFFVLSSIFPTKNRGIYDLDCIYLDYTLLFLILFFSFSFSFFSFP